MNRAIAEMQAGRGREIRRLVKHLAAHVHHRDLLEGRDVHIKIADQSPDRGEAVAPDVRHHADGNGSPGPIAALIFQVTIRVRDGPDEAPVIDRLLDRAGKKALDEVAL